MFRILKISLRLVFTYIGIFVIMSCFSKIFCPGVTKRCYHIQEVSAFLRAKMEQWREDEILLAFDIDLTLLQPEHPACYVPNIRKYLSVYRSIEKQYPKMNPSIPLTFVFFEPQHLVDAGIYPLLQDTKNIRKIALTATPSGEFPQLGRLEKLRYQQLVEKQISFEEYFAEDDVLLEECLPYRGNKPCFYKGVLCSNCEGGATTKGDALCAFLKHIAWIPKLVVLIDDKASNLKNVYKILKKNYPATQFVGIKYLGAHDYCPKTITKEDFKTYWENCFSKTYQYEKQFCDNYYSDKI